MKEINAEELKGNLIEMINKKWLISIGLMIYYNNLPGYGFDCNFIQIRI